MEKGPLVKMQIGPGRFVMMFEADVRAQGMLSSKVKPKAVKKMRRPAENKSIPQENESESTPKADDFTTIPGIGKGTARALAANGITTFEQLRQAGTLSYIPSGTMQAIEAWRRV